MIVLLDSSEFLLVHVIAVCRSKNSQLRIMCAKQGDIRTYFGVEDGLQAAFNKAKDIVAERALKEVLLDLCKHHSVSKKPRGSHRYRWTKRIQQPYADCEALREEFNASYKYAPPISQETWAKIFTSIRSTAYYSEAYKNAQKVLAWNRNLHFFNYFK